jgi:hypothetical protein
LNETHAHGPFVGLGSGSTFPSANIEAYAFYKQRGKNKREVRKAIVLAFLADRGGGRIGESISTCTGYLHYIKQLIADPEAVRFMTLRGI